MKTIHTRPFLAVVAASMFAGGIAGCGNGESAPPPDSTVLRPDLADRGGTDQPHALSVVETPWWQLNVASAGGSAGTSMPTSSEPPSGSDAPTTTRAEQTGAPHVEQVTMSGEVLFEPDSAELNVGAASQLGIVLAVLRTRPAATLRIDGHVDKGSGGSETVALDLSAARADAVRDWFVANGIAGNRLAAQGFGDSRPLYPSDSDAHRAANRRCELTITGAS